MSRGVGRTHSSDPALLWLWRRPAATALITPLGWEPPYAAGAALEKTKREKNIYIYTSYQHLGQHIHDSTPPDIS